MHNAAFAENAVDELRGSNTFLPDTRAVIVGMPFGNASLSNSSLA